MKASIERTNDGLRIEAQVAEEKQAAILRELRKCASGACSCPTPQYERLSSIDVRIIESGIAVDLRVKPDEEVDVGDIERCLAHTASQVGA
jgi:hypothetical protein